MLTTSNFYRSVRSLSGVTAACLVVLCLTLGMTQAMAQTIFPIPSQETGAASEVASDGLAAGSNEADRAVEDLLHILRDEDQRNALIERLQALPSSQEAELPTSADTAQTSSFARDIADLTKGAAERTYRTALAVWRDFTGIRALVSGVSEQRQARIAANAPSLAATILTTIAILWLLSRLFGRLTQNRAAAEDTVWTTILRITINTASDILALAMAYAAGYILAISVFGSGTIAVEKSLYLNAFLIAGVARIVLCVFVRPNRSDETLSNLTASVQAAIYRRLVFIGGLLIYGITAIVPIANVWVSVLAGRSLRVTIVTVAALLALLAIRHISRLVNEEHAARIEKTERAADPAPDADTSQIVEAAKEEATQATLSFWHKLWPWLATAYVLFAYIIAIARPSLMADLIGSATLKSLVAGAILASAFRFMKRASSAGAPVPKALKNALPELKTRLDSFVPYVLRIVSIALMALAAGFLIDAWHLFDVGSWLDGPLGADIIWRGASAFLIVATIFLIWAIISSWIDHRLTLDLEGRNVSARSRTLLALFRNAFTVALFIFGSMTALSQIGIDIAPLLAGAGVIGLAIGFGSQKLVQDIITGIFIQLDNAINDGDVVTVGAITGKVEKLTIRSVALRDIDGTYHIVPFSSVDTVSNFMRKFAYHVAIVGVAYKEKVPDVKEAMFEAFRRLKDGAHGPVILEDLEMHGVVALADSSVNIRARIKTRPGEQWKVGRAYTELVKIVFDECGIEIPYPHRQMVYATEKPTDQSVIALPSPPEVLS